MQVSVPYEITLLSNENMPITKLAEFQYLMKLHYSQTAFVSANKVLSFSTLWNYTTLKHSFLSYDILFCFSTLWNYTTLKPLLYQLIKFWVSVPYEITLLSNCLILLNYLMEVSVPYEITLLSNCSFGWYYWVLVSVPYEITLLSNFVQFSHGLNEFQYLMKLHYSQTNSSTISKIRTFQYLMKLHYSQTSLRNAWMWFGFSTLWNYTTLKLSLSNA